MGTIYRKINIQPLFVLLYMLISLSLMVRVLGLWGIPVKTATGLYLYIGWGFFCFTSYYWFAPYQLAKMNVRKPTIGEEAPLQKLVDEVQLYAGKKINIDIRIEESVLYNACASGRNTIVLSKGLIQDFNIAKLSGIIAHEIGHLRDKDTMMVTAYYMAGRLHGLLSLITNHVFDKRRFRVFFPLKERVLICVLLISGIVFLAPKLMVPLTVTILYVSAIHYMDLFFNWTWLVLSRYCEYRQDKFAWSLGYGNHLAVALAKLAQSSPQEVSWFTITICGTHPVIYHRIRRLEGLPPSDKSVVIENGVIF